MLNCIQLGSPDHAVAWGLYHCFLCLVLFEVPMGGAPGPPGGGSPRTTRQGEPQDRRAGIGCTELRLSVNSVCLQLVVHVGVSGMATTVTLEKCGHNKGYKGLDNCRFCPGSQCCVEDGPESIDSVIDMDAVCERLTTLGLDVSVTISQDAGR